MSFIMPPSAVTSTSSIIIRITTVHPFATSWPSSPKGGARTLLDLLSVSYGKITILLTGSLRSPPYPGCAGLPPKGETTHYDLCVASAPSNHVRCASTGKRVTRFSGRFAPLRIVFPCHPYAGGRINRSMLSCRDMAPWLSTHSAPACGGKVVAPATKGGLHFLTRQGGCMVLYKLAPSII